MSTATRTTASAPKIEDLLARVLRGEVRVPRFQRGINWKLEDEILLLDSIHKGFPIGSLLFWERKLSADRFQFGGLWIDGSAQGGFFVVDGQQRLNALTKHLMNAESQVVFDFDEQLFTRKVNRSSLQVPVYRLGDNERLLDWMSLNAGASERRGEVFALSKRLREYSVPIYELSTDDEEVVREVFARTNSTGKRLKQAEIFAAFDTSDQTGLSPTQLGARLNEMQFGRISVSVVKQLLAAMQGRDVTAEFRPQWGSQEEKQRQYGLAIGALRSAIQLLRTDADILHQKLLPFEIQLIVLATMFARFPEPHERTRMLMSRWVWRSGFDTTTPGFAKARVFNRAISGTDEAVAIRRLLATTPKPTTVALSDTFSLRQARSRLESTLLTRSLDAAQRTQVIEHLESDGASKLFRRLDHQSPDRSIGNMALVLSGERVVPPGGAVPDVSERRRGLEAEWERIVSHRAGLTDSDRPALDQLIDASELADG